MQRALSIWLCLFGTVLLAGRSLANTPMALNMTGLYNYDAVGTSNEITYATGKNQTLATAIGGHNLANAGRAFTNTDSLSSGTALPRYGVIANTYTDAFVYDTKSGSTYVSTPNALRIIATATSSSTVSATTTVTVNSSEQINYNNLNFLFVQNRSTGAGTYQTTVTITYTNGTTVVKDTGAVTVAANAAGGTFGSAGVNGQGGLSNATDTDTTVTNEFSSSYGVVTSGSVSTISSTAGSNLWQLTTPIALTTTLVPKSVTYTVTASGTGNWNELVVFGMAATPTYCAPPPATDPAATLNGTFDPGRLAAHPRLMFTPSTLPALKAFYNNTAQSQIWRNQFDAYIGSSVTPVNTNFLTDATEAQRQAFWRLPTAALAWVLTGNQSAFKNALGTLQLYVALPDWETSIERNSGLAAANNLVGVALAYDWLYNDLTPANGVDASFREQVRQKLLAQARAIYYGGYKLGNSNVAAIYWQDDYLTNHRWARGDGLTLAAMASYSGAASENYLMNQVIAEMTTENSNLPPDGSHHESLSYLVFGGNHLTMSQEAMDDCMGTNLLGASFFQNVGKFRIQGELSDFNNSLDYGDFGGAPDEGSYNNFLLKLADHNSDATLRSATLALFNAQPSALDFSWFSLLWDNPNLTGSSYQNYPLTGYYSNMGVTFFRDSWTTGGVAAMFKCAPLGGVTLNQYRDAHSETYVNVGHDDPDANSFIFFSGDDYLAASDQYSQRKQSEQQNTVLVNGKGQNPVGRTEPQDFDQPATSGSMLGMATSFAPVVTSNGVTVSEGEASGSYPAISGTRPAISRYRRLFMWNPNKYILVLDDLRSGTAVTFSSLVQAPGLTTVDSTQGLFTLTGTTTKTCPFQVVGSQTLSFTTLTSTADNMSTSLNYQQLRVATHSATTSLQLAAVYNPWQQTNLRVALQNATSTTEDIAVTGTGIADTYRWTFATGSTTASSINLLVAPAFTSGTPPLTGSIGTPYSFTFTASGYPAPTFAATGNLPPGLTFSSTTGALTGTPTQNGSFTFTITATGYGTPAAQTYTVVISGTTYSSWVSAEHLTGNAALPSAVNSADGLTNVVKYSLGLHAATIYPPSSPSLPIVQVKSLPAGTSPAGNYLTLTFTGVATDVTYNVEATSDPSAGWTTVYTYKNSPPPGTVVVQDQKDVTNYTKRFMRLNVTIQQ